MRTALFTLLFGLVLTAACATRPNRTEPTWKVPVGTRQATLLRMNEVELLESNDNCGEREIKRAKNLVNVLERELYDAGFDIEADDVEADAIDTTLWVRLENCNDALTGDLGVTLAKDGQKLGAVEAQDVVFSNLRVGANQLVDLLLLSDAFEERLESTPVAVTSTTTSTAS